MRKGIAGSEVTLSVDETYYKAMLDVLPERVIRFRLPDLTILYCNAAWSSSHHLTPAEAIGRTMDELLSPAARADLELQLVQLSPENTLARDPTARPAPNAPGRWLEWVDQYLPSAEGAEVLAVGRDVTERHIAEVFLADSEARFRALADNSADVVWRVFTEPYPHFDYLSPSIESILGYPAAIFLADFDRLLEILDNHGRDLIQRSFDGEPMPPRYDLRYRCADGSIVILETHTTDLPGGLQGVSRDVTELRGLQESLSARALRDPLTGLANRHLLNELLEVALARTHRSDLPLAVAFLDLDGLKIVNDTYGHDAGDFVLCETARRLVGLTRTADVVARLGGDEFVIVYEPNAVGSDNLISRIREGLAAPIAVTETISVFCTASIGHADTRTVGRDPAILMAAADMAMYESKRARDRNF